MAAADEDELLTNVGLSSLEVFADAISTSNVAAGHRRAVVILAWETARRGTAPGADEPNEYLAGLEALLSAEEAALAEIGAIGVSAALEAAMSLPNSQGSRLRAAGVQNPFQWLRWRVEACSRAASSAGVSASRCEAIQKLGMSMLEPYRDQLLKAQARNQATDVPQAGKGKGKGADEARFWVLPDASGEWRGPLTAREVLRLAEAKLIGPEAPVWGLGAAASEPPVAVPPRDAQASAQSVWKALAELGNIARKS